MIYGSCPFKFPLNFINSSPPNRTHKVSASSPQHIGKFIPSQKNHQRMGLRLNSSFTILLSIQFRKKTLNLQNIESTFLHCFLSLHGWEEKKYFVIHTIFHMRKFQKKNCTENFHFKINVFFQKNGKQKEKNVRVWSGYGGKKTHFLSFFFSICYLEISLTTFYVWTRGVLIKNDCRELQDFFFYF